MWLLNLLVDRGYSAILLEREHLGAGQTLASQGMIHGGFKYALNGAFSAQEKSLFLMPDRWKRYLLGRGEIDLRDLKVKSQCFVSRMHRIVLLERGSKEHYLEVSSPKSNQIVDLMPFLMLTWQYIF